MSWTYEQRLNLPLSGQPSCQFWTVSGLLVANGYERIVIGGRGPYIEFNTSHLVSESLYIPPDQEWREHSEIAYYREWRTTVDYVKVYHQLRTVDYADYRIGFWYISPFDLRLDNNGLIVKPLPKRRCFDLFPKDEKRDRPT